MKKKVINKNQNKMIIIVIIILVLFLSIFLFTRNNYYAVKPRTDNIDDYKKNDSDYYKTVGWLRVQGTNIDYPVIYPKGLDLTTKMDNFLWTDVDNEKLSNKIVIKGHNIMNLSTNPLIADKNHQRFEQLLSFVYLDFVRDNKYIQYTFNGKAYLYKIFSITFATDDDIGFINKGDYKENTIDKYIKRSLKNSIFKFDIDVNKKDKIISLITCTRMYGTYSDKQFKIDARLVRPGELNGNYHVSKNSNYKEIDNIMKGGKNDEKA